MTVSMPVTLPAPAVAGKAGSAAPSKGVTSAPGQIGKAAGDGADATEVAGMFAALVAALTQQMQPVTTSTPAATGGEGGAEAAVADGAIAPFVGPNLAVEDAAVPAGQTPQGLPVSGAPVVTTAAVATDEAPESSVSQGLDHVLGEATQVAEANKATETTEVAEVAKPTKAAKPAAEAIPGASEAVAETDAADSTHRIVGRSDARATDEERPAPASGTIPATPAQPAHGAGPATPAVAAAPASNGSDADGPPVLGLPTAPVSAAPTTPAEAVAAPAAPPAPAADPHLQIARVVRPLQLGDDGAYELALDLTPAELGRVRIDVELRGTTIHLSLRADNPATRELLQGSLNQLRAELEGAGLQAGNLDVGGQRPDGRESAGHNEAATPSQVLDEEPGAAAATTPTASDTDTDTGVDVLA